MSVTVLGAILAGGRASRMGGVAKGLVPFGDAILMDAALKSLAHIAEQVKINANTEMDAYQALGYDVFKDVAPYLDCGPLSGIYAALQQTKTIGASHVLLSPCDTPNVSETMFALLQQQALLNPELAFYFESASGTQPLHGIIPVSPALEELEHCLSQGKHKVLDFYQKIGARAVFWEDEAAFLNINSLAEM